MENPIDNERKREKSIKQDDRKKIRTKGKIHNTT
jgi:hypothetical protein